MAYHVRFFSMAAEPVSLAMLHQAIQRIDREYTVEPDPSTWQLGLLYHGDQLCAELELNVPGDGLFEPEMEEFFDRLASENGASTGIEDRLRAAQQIICLRVSAHVASSREDPPLRELEPLWTWLFEHSGGLLHADRDGLYDRQGLLLKLD